MSGFEVMGDLSCKKGVKRAEIFLGNLKKIAFLHDVKKSYQSCSEN
jgi:hypothetical protein